MPGICHFNRRREIILCSNPITRTYFIIVILTLFYCEIFEHWVHRFQWKDLPSKNNDFGSESNSLRILFVADAQIQGVRYELPGILGYITRLDSDRYLSRTFSHALAHSTPDVIIFMGDELDEGSVSTDEEFKEMADRFHDLFYEQWVLEHGQKVLSLPGDNDVGGEGQDKFTAENMKRFMKSFPGNLTSYFKFLEVVQSNRMSNSLDFSYIPKRKVGNVRFLVSHVPITAFRGYYSKVLTENSDMDIIFSAHEHKSMHLITDRKSGKHLNTEKWENNDVWTMNVFANHNELHEIMIPTCSYRMGVPQMGYGVANIDKNGRLFYTVYWLPSRFKQLFIYIGILAAGVVIGIAQVCFPCCRKYFCTTYKKIHPV